MTPTTTLVATLGILCGAAAVRAEPPASDVATSNALFAEAKRLLGESRTEEACARFEASMRAAPRLGVQLNVADCYERLGRTASAWVVFGEAAARAQAQRDPREAFARERLAALVPRLSRIAITVAPQAGEPTVTRDGQPVPREALGLAVAVDPGTHTIEARAADRAPWSTQVVVARAGEVLTVVVPELASPHAGEGGTVARRELAPPHAGEGGTVARRELAPPHAVGLELAPAQRAMSREALVSSRPVVGARRPTTAAWIAGGVAVGGLGLGLYFGHSAGALWGRAAPGCDSSGACTGAAYADAMQSRRHAGLATATFALGGVAATAAAVLYLRSPRRVHVAPSAAPGEVGMVVGGGF
ncbi:MAG: hypothetical protein KF773_39370 [Deltaproteobacteria bacterium]|nr:hypothetical protein [Deltaproteobacteria bacterium]